MVCLTSSGRLERTGWPLVICSREDHAVVDQAPEVVLTFEDFFDGQPDEWVPVRQDVVQGEKKVGTTPARGAEQPAGWGQATQGYAGGGEQAIRVKDPKSRSDD